MNSGLRERLWVEKYRPKTFDDYIFHDSHVQKAVMNMIKDRSIPHLLFSGPAGCGKTTLAQLLIQSLHVPDCDVLAINAADENSIDTMREKIKTFVMSYAYGDFKIVYLEEASEITVAGQGVMRRLMEEYADTARFILTCNYEHRITDPIKSRCQHYRFKAADKDDIAEYVIKILAAERIKCDIELVDTYISAGYPDVRKIVNLVQKYSIDGVLVPPPSDSSSVDYKFKLIELVETDRWQEARKVACDNVAPEEWEDVYKFLYENIHKSPKFKSIPLWEEAIVIIADYLYKHTIVADPEINGAAMFIALGQLK